MKKLVDEVRQFREERDWEQFHSPKNLAMALMVECAELAEHFQWLTQEQSRNLPAGKKEDNNQGCVYPDPRQRARGGGLQSFLARHG